tara:strand:- start:1175 stop:1681 length:507 start_codon:yes stop_codon:yes gene_type:complete
LGQEFFINSQELEDKVRTLLPSQGGAGAGFDLSASTQIIPIIDLTESAEGSNVRQDLQSALSFNSVTTFRINNGSSTVINNTGYWRVFGTTSGFGLCENIFRLSDGVSNKDFYSNTTDAGGDFVENFDFTIFLGAGDSLIMEASTADSFITGCFRQIADINGVLVNPN